MNMRWTAADLMAFKERMEKSGAKVRTHFIGGEKESLKGQRHATAVRKLGSAPLLPKMSQPEERLAFHLRAEGLGHFKREFKFWTGRKFRFDFAYPEEKLGIEVDGGLYSQGRHTRAKGFEDDCVKLNEAALLGWRVLRFSPGQVSQGRAIATIKRALGVK